MSIGTLYTGFYFGVPEVPHFPTAKGCSLYTQYSDSHARQDPFLHQRPGPRWKKAQQQRGWMEVGMCLCGDTASSF